jgi:hypothetical protein
MANIVLEKKYNKDGCFSCVEVRMLNGETTMFKKIDQKTHNKLRSSAYKYITP